MDDSEIHLDEVRTTGGDADSSAASYPMAVPMTILLVDDDEDCRAMVREAIRACDPDHRVIERGDGASALEFLKSADIDARPGLIFLDVEMPAIDGLEILRRIKADPKLADIPVVMLTGVAEPDCMHKAATLGANSYTVKPVRAEQFLDTVQASATYWLNVHQYPKRHTAQADARR